MTSRETPSRIIPRSPGSAVQTVILLAILAPLMAVSLPGPLFAAWIWVEGEKPANAQVKRHPWWYDKVKTDQLSGGDFLSHWDPKQVGEATYRAVAPTAGDYDLWVRANHVQAKLSYKVNDAAWAAIDLAKDPQQSTNIAEDGKYDLRFLAWTKVGKVPLKQGPNSVRFRMESENNHHGYLDCFVLTNEPFTPNGIQKPDQAAASRAKGEVEVNGWFTFAPKPDTFADDNPIDLRGLNEKKAGDGGFILARDGRFFHADTDEPVRFWGVNGPAAREPEALRREARLLAKRGVNLVRIHHGYTNEKGEFDRAAVLQALDVVEAMKAEGIYTHFSIYFPIWLKPAPGTPWLDGYNGQAHPFAALMFNEEFQGVYRGWWKALLTTPHPKTGKRLIDDPAVFGLEIQNEDSFFFWTFDPANIPEPQLQILESRYYQWLKRQYGTIETAIKRWKGIRVERDRPGEGRMGFRPLFNVFTQKTPRDKDAVRFLAEVQRNFYRDTYRFLKLLGFKGVITASNWTTASPEVLGPIEKYTYVTTDFLDRHGYFGCLHKGDQSAWSIREGHTFADRSALRFEPEQPGGPKLFSHPAVDVTYDDKPSMISETTWTRPNRFRSEAPLFYAAYGALQGTDAVVHFTFDGGDWQVKPLPFMQPWTLMTPAMTGQFPAAAMIFRKGLIEEGEILADLTLRPSELLDLRGTPLPQDGALDELRLKDVPKAGEPMRPGQLIDPLIHFAGRTRVRFNENGGTNVVKDLSPYINRDANLVVSSNGQVRLDYGTGLLVFNAPNVQGFSGDLREAASVEIPGFVLESRLDLGHVVAVSLDDQPIAASKKILLQVMTEEAAAGFRTERHADGTRKILNIGVDPWMVRQPEGIVRFRRADAGRLEATALDANGERVKPAGTAAEIKLLPTTLYYLIEPARSRPAAKAKGATKAANKAEAPGGDAPKEKPAPATENEKGKEKAEAAPAEPAKK